MIKYSWRHFSVLQKAFAIFISDSVSDFLKKCDFNLNKGQILLCYNWHKWGVTPSQWNYSIFMQVQLRTEFGPSLQQLYIIPLSFSLYRVHYNGYKSFLYLPFLLPIFFPFPCMLQSKAFRFFHLYPHWTAQLVTSWVRVAESYKCRAERDHLAHSFSVYPSFSLFLCFFPMFGLFFSHWFHRPNASLV